MALWSASRSESSSAEAIFGFGSCGKAVLSPQKFPSLVCAAESALAWASRCRDFSMVSMSRPRRANANCASASIRSVARKTVAMLCLQTIAKSGQSHRKRTCSSEAHIRVSANCWLSFPLFASAKLPGSSRSCVTVFSWSALRGGSTTSTLKG